MKVVYESTFHDKLKKVNVRIRKSVKEKILIFSKKPHDPRLNNHPLEREYEGLRSINITAVWRAVYEEVHEGNQEPIAYFITLGTHKQLYAKKQPD